MLRLKVFKKVQKLRCSQYTILRLQSTAEAGPKESGEEAERTYSKPLINRELKPLKGNFLHNLFSGVVNKSIFEYPAVLQEENIGIVLSHCSKVESFLSNNSNCDLNKGTIEELTKLELFGLSLPHEYGGAGYNETESKFLLECTAAVPKIARFLSYNENFGCHILNAFGSKEQKKKYLPGLAAGKSFISFAYLENGPLIDLQKFEGYAFLDEENGYILNAEKKWVHSADKSNLFLVMAKLSSLLDDSCKIKFSMFIIDKNTPGVKVHKLKSQNAQDHDIFDVSFENVKLPRANLLGESTDLDGFLVLKHGLSHCHIGDAVVCLHLVKRITNDIIQFIQEHYILRNQNFFDDNLAYLTMYTYALESVIYFITGRFDKYENPDLFEESVLAKIIAIDCLKNAIQNYIQVFQRQSLKETGILEEALKAWYYYSVLDENIEYLKLMTASEALVHGAPYLSKIANDFLKPYDNPLKVLKWTLAGESIRKKNQIKHDFKMELHRTFSAAADTLELSSVKLLNAAEELFIKYGETALNNANIIIKFGELSAYLYSSIACLSRASSAVCYEFQNFEHEEKIAKAFAFFVARKIELQIEEEIRNEKSHTLFRMIGKTTFKCKGYPAEHPLSRTF